MSINIDSAIFIGFLVVNLIFGLWSSRGIKNIKEYAIGDRKFSTATIAATIIATWISGGIFFTIVSESYSNGLYFMWAGAGDAICLLIVGYFFAPRLAEFLGKISIAEAMGELYGKPVRIITSAAGFVGVSGVIAMQLKISGLLFEYCFDVPSAYGVIIGGVIVTLYSTLGGIKSVTFTDVIQFFTFGTIIPTIALFVLSNVDSMDVVVNTLSYNKAFDYHEVFDFTKPKSFYYLFLFLFFAVPAFNPAIFQRIAMAKNTNQIRQSFIIAGFTCLLLMIVIDWIGILLLSTHPDLPPSDVVKHLIFDYSYTGLKGLTIAGIMAMLMSTADSYINSTSVLVVHDFCKPLGINIIKNELNFSRLASLLIGIFSITLSLYSSSLLQLALTTYSFYMPIVTVPFTMSLLGFRSSGKSVLIGMGGGFLTIISWEIFFKTTGIDGLVPGMGANLLLLLTSHYILKQSGGWVGIKDSNPLQQIRQERRTKMRNFVTSCRNFNLFVFLRNNSPRGEAMYTYLGFFCMVSAFSTMHTIPKEIQFDYAKIINFIYPSVLFIGTLLVSYPLWLPSWKNKYAISIFWNIAIFYVLICIGFSLVIMSKFAPLQLMAFMINLIVIAVLVKWQWALLMITVGLLLIIQFFKSFLGTNYLSEHYANANFETAYLLLLVSGSLIAFLKPKQQYQELTEEKNEHLNERVSTQEKELREAAALKGEFIRNVAHEYHAPMTGISSMAEVLFENYDKLSDQQVRSGIETILKSSVRLDAFDSNISSLSKLSKPNYDLKLESIDISDLLHARIAVCRKLYEENKEDRKFILDIQDDLIVDVDKYYLSQVFDNLIINAISYCKQGNIIVTLKQDENYIQFSISDEGIGIPMNELHNIFGEFMVGSKTWTPAGGRGIGLTLCKRAVEVHGGTIKAESDGEKGAIFSFYLLCKISRDNNEN